VTIVIRQFLKGYYTSFSITSNIPYSKKISEIFAKKHQALHGNGNTRKNRG
jgi:hypothetical protein